MITEHEETNPPCHPVTRQTSMFATCFFFLLLFFLFLDFLEHERSPFVMWMTTVRLVPFLRPQSCAAFSQVPLFAHPSYVPAACLAHPVRVP